MTEQTHWRLYEDDGSEPTVALAAEDTSASVNTQDNIRLRGSLTGTFANYMVAWYPVNEGSGTSIVNIASPKYADPFPNLDLHFDAGNAALFWSQGPLYGNTGLMDASCYGLASAVSAVGLLSDFAEHSGWNYPAPIATFIYINRATPSSYWSMGFSEVSCGASWGYSTSHEGVVGHYASEIWNFSLQFGTGAVIYGYRPTSEVVNRWMFLCYYYDPGANQMKLGVVNDEGYMYTAGTTVNSSTYYQNNRIRLFASNSSTDYDYFYGALGDWMLFHQDLVFSFGRSDWAYYYDMLRGRYNMASRKGW